MKGVKMKYDINKDKVLEILRATDIANTLNGGVAQPKIKTQKQSDQFVIYLEVPGLDIGSLHIEIKNKQLLVYHFMSFNHKEMNLTVPHVVAMFPITLDVDYNKISASHENDALRISIPYSDIARNYQRSIKIKK